MININIAKLADIPRVQELHAKLFDYEDSILKLYNSQYDKSESSRKYFESRLNPKKGRIFIALNEKEIVGYLCAGIGNEEYRENSKYTEIESIYVEESSRNLGVGKMLIERFKEWTKLKGITRIKVEAVQANLKAVDFYTREGFTPTYIELEMVLK